MDGIRKAMILAAGYGQRARPLTLVRPKPLFPVLNRPSIRWTLDLLAAAGVAGVAVNTHHLAEALERYLAGIETGMRIQTFREERILGTGGGLKNAAGFLDDGPFILINADVVVRIDLPAVVAAHRASKALATLVLHDCPLFNQVMVDSDGRICGFRDDPAPGAARRLAFTGIHVIEPEVLANVPEGPGDIIDVYRNLVRAGRDLRGYVADGLPWWDIGTRERYLEAHADLISSGGAETVLMGAGARVEPGAVVEGWACLGDGAVVEAGAYVSDSVLWPRVRVAAGARMVGSVATDGAVVAGEAVGRSVVAGA